MTRNVVKLILYVLVFKRRVIIQRCFLHSQPIVCLAALSFAFFARLAVHSFTFHSGFKNKQTTSGNGKEYNGCVLVRYNSSYFIPFFKWPHYVYSRELEIRRPILKISFSNFDAVFLILFETSPILIDKLNKCKFLQESWIDIKLFLMDVCGIVVFV